MFGITLYTRSGEAVTSVIVPPWKHPPEAYLWGERTFFRRDDGKYYEGLMVFIVPLVNHCLDASKAKGAALECSMNGCSCACQGCMAAKQFGLDTWLPMRGERCDICGDTRVIETTFGKDEKEVLGRRCEAHRHPVGGGV